MKTFKLQFATLTVLATFITLNLNANNSYLRFAEENYINDIPFNTEKIAEKYSIQTIEINFDFSEENEIYDIPFNTACVTADCRFELAFAEAFEMEEENYINDIPFNTENITKNSNLIDFQEEAYINDIPFDTFSLAKELNSLQYAINK